MNSRTKLFLFTVIIITIVHTQPRVFSPEYGNPDFSIGRYFYNDSTFIQKLTPTTERVYAGKPHKLWFSQQGYYFATEELIDDRTDSVYINLYNHNGDLLTRFMADYVFTDSFSDGRQYYISDSDESIIRFQGVSGEIYFSQPPYTSTTKISLESPPGDYYDSRLWSTMNTDGTIFFLWGDDNMREKANLFPRGAGIISYYSNGAFNWRYEFEDFIKEDERIGTTEVHISESGSYCVAYSNFHQTEFSDFELMVVVLDSKGKLLYHFDDTMVRNIEIHEGDDLLILEVSHSRRLNLRGKVVYIQLSTGEIIKTIPY